MAANEGPLIEEHKKALAELKALVQQAKDLVHDLEEMTDRTRALLDQPINHAANMDRNQRRS
jgi:hypothetical protein